MKFGQAFLLGLLLPVAASALEIVLPTDNDGLLRGREADFYQPTAAGFIESGTFGCVRRGGTRFHEGIDIRSLKRDRRGESIDPIYAVADGEVVFINLRAGLSNYGRYLILRHRWDGVEVHTLYAHLSAVAKGLKVGQPVRRSQVIATMGRSANTREGIPPERAHLHFEVCFLLNNRFEGWNRKRHPDAPPFGSYNGQNFIGIDPAAFLRAFIANPKLKFNEYVARQPIAFTILVGARPGPWLALHPEQIQPRAGKEAVPVAYEIGVTAWGLPIAIWPRAAGELSDAQRRSLQRGAATVARVNDEALKKDCRRLIERTSASWRLSERGQEWLSLLLYNP